MTRKNIVSSLMALVIVTATCLLTACSQPAKPEVDIGERADKISWLDGEKSDRKTITASDVAFGSPTAPVRVTRTYGHGTKEAIQIYRVAKTETAEFVASQQAYMIWVDGTLYRFKDPYNIENLGSKKPDVVLKSLPANADLSSFYELVGSRRFEVGRASYDGRTVNVTVVRTFARDTKYVKEYIHRSTDTIAEAVSSQDGWMFYMGSELYQVRSNRTVEHLSSKPTVDLGIRRDMISGQDSEDRTKRVVKATGWSLDKKHLVVSSEQHFLHETRFETEVYVLQRQQDAYYSSLYKCWAAEVAGDTYLFDLDGCRDSITDSRIKFGDVPEQLKSSSTSTCSPKPTPTPKPEEPTKDEVNAGRLTEKIQNFDQENMDRRKVTPLEGPKDDNTWPVSVTRHYVNVSKTKLTKYYIQKNKDAQYNASKRGYVIEVGKDTYVISKTGKLRKL